MVTKPASHRTVAWWRIVGGWGDGWREERRTSPSMADTTPTGLPRDLRKASFETIRNRVRFCGNRGVRFDANTVYTSRKTPRARSPKPASLVLSRPSSVRQAVKVVLIFSLFLSLTLLRVARSSAPSPPMRQMAAGPGKQSVSVSVSTPPRGFGSPRSPRRSPPRRPWTTGGSPGGAGSPGSPLSPPAARLKKDGSSFVTGIAELTDIGLTHRGSREAIVGRMKDMCRVRQEQKRFADSLEEEIMQLEQGARREPLPHAPHEKKRKKKKKNQQPTHLYLQLVRTDKKKANEDSDSALQQKYKIHPATTYK